MAFQTKFNSVEQARMSPVANWAMVELGIKDLDSNKDVKQINQYLKKNEDPYSKQIRLANEQTDALRNQIGQIQTDNQAKLDQIARDNAATIESILVQNRTDMDNLTTSLTDSFNTTLNQQNNAWESRYGDLMGNYNTIQGELNTISQAYDAQTRMMGNLSRAATPSANASAEVPTLGDNRNNPARRAENNNLSSLAILTGLGSAGNPMSGLQLA